MRLMQAWRRLAAQANWTDVAIQAAIVAVLVAYAIYRAKGG